jgi:hypothetical protein
MRRPPAAIGPFASYYVTSCGRICETSPSRRKVKPPTGRLYRRSWAITGSTTTGGVLRPCWRYGVPQTSTKRFWRQAAPRHRFAAGRTTRSPSSVCTRGTSPRRRSSRSASTMSLLNTLWVGRGRCCSRSSAVMARPSATRCPCQRTPLHTTASLAGSVEIRVGSRRDRPPPERSRPSQWDCREAEAATSCLNRVEGLVPELCPGAPVCLLPQDHQ